MRIQFAGLYIASRAVVWGVGFEGLGRREQGGVVVADAFEGVTGGVGGWAGVFGSAESLEAGVVAWVVGAPSVRFDP